MLFSSLAILIIIFLPGLYSGNASPGTGGSLLTPGEVLFAPVLGLSLARTLAMNSLGMEGSALQTLYLFPVRSLDVLWGKNLAAGALAGATQIVLVLGLAAITGGWGYALPALVGGMAGVLVALGCGNVTSVLVPFRMRRLRAGSGSYGAEGGCLRGLLSLLFLAVTLALLVPVAAAIGVPLVLAHGSWLALTLPAALLYGVLIHQATTRLIAPTLTERAPEILHTVVLEA
jgi:hypothetical protein